MYIYIRDLKFKIQIIMKHNYFVYIYIYIYFYNEAVTIEFKNEGKEIVKSVNAE